MNQIPIEKYNSLAQEENLNFSITSKTLKPEINRFLIVGKSENNDANKEFNVFPSYFFLLIYFIFTKSQNWFHQIYIM